MALFQFTPEMVLEQAQELFLSEQFQKAIQLLRECMSEDVTNEQILCVLKGEMGVVFKEDGDISISKDAVNQDYKEQVEFIIANYDNLLECQDKLWVVDTVKPMSTLDYSKFSALFKQISENTGKLLTSSKISASSSTALYEFLRASNNGEHQAPIYIHKVSPDEFLILFFKANDKTFYTGISCSHQDIEKVSERHLKLNEWI